MRAAPGVLNMPHLVATHPSVDNRLPRPAWSMAMLLLSLTTVVAVLFIVSLLTGQAFLPMIKLWLSSRSEDNDILRLILTEIRLPRALLAVLIGATLGLSGAVLQGLLRNPLAEPSLIGASATAALGAVLSFYFGLANLFPYALPLGGMLGAMVGVVLVLFLAGRDDKAFTLILAGVAINSLAASLTSLALNLAPSPYAALEIVYWLLGSLADRSFDQVRIATPFILLGWLLLFSSGRALDALSLGEDTARSLGFSLESLRLRIILGIGLAVGASVAVAGSIGFVGLVVPHLLRPWVQQRPSLLLSVSALAGAALTLAADIAARLLIPGTELKLGVVTALIGAPFFLHLLIKLRGSLT
jgi:iron complex transport system permease protein